MIIDTQKQKPDLFLDEDFSAFKNIDDAIECLEFNEVGKLETYHKGEDVFLVIVGKEGTWNSYGKYFDDGETKFFSKKEDALDFAARAVEREDVLSSAPAVEE